MDEVSATLGLLLHDECQELFGVSLSAVQLAQFHRYSELLLAWNERLNLTAITQPVDVYRKHFLDSLSVVAIMGQDVQGQLLDVGSGAGLPGLAIKILFPHLHVTLCDALQKRVHFLSEVIVQLNLQGIEAVHGRAEDLSQLPAYRDRYQWVVARAVARLSTLCEWCLPFVEPGGQFVALKGPAVASEVAECEGAARALCAKVDQVFAYTLPEQAGERHLVAFRKLNATPRRFPRKPGEAKRNPLS